jgi:iron complex outermembrane receptor protein
MTLRGETLAAVALWVCLAFSTPAFAEPSYAQATKYNLDISGADLMTALPALSRQTGAVVLYPYALAQVRSNPVKGLYTVPEALQLMLQGTGFSGDVTAQGAISISRQKRRCDTEEEAMLRDSKSTVSVIALLASLFSAPVCAQPASGAAGAGRGAQAMADGSVESIVVTGSRVISDIANSPTPLTVVTTDQLLLTTPSNISDALNKLPIFQGSASQRNASNGGGNFLNLRRFGAQRTLVLLDGMRYTPSNANGSVDVSNLPSMLMSRVDVVTGGASAVYGSDAITGVVNFILDKNFEGVKYEGNGGISDYGDGASYKAGVAAGTSLFGGRGHIEGSLQYYHADGVYKRNRPDGAANWSSYGLGTTASPFTNIQQGRLNTTSFGGKIICTSCSVNGQQFIRDDVIGPFNAGVIPLPGGSVSIGGDGVYVHNTHAIATQKNAEAFARFSYNLNENTNFWIQGAATQANLFNWFFPSQIDIGRQTTRYFKNNPFLAADQQALLGNNGTFNTSGPNDNTFQMVKWLDNTVGRGTNSVTRNLTLSTGLNGGFGNYTWDIHYTHGESRDSITGVNNGNNQFQRAQSDVVVENGQVKCWNNTAAAIAQFGDLYPGCVPLNPFGPTSISDPAFHYWSRNTNAVLTNSLDDVAGSITGDVFKLPAGPVRVALSGEMRWLGYDIKSDASPTAVVNCTGLRLCGGPTQTLWDNNTIAAVSARQNVWEFALEGNIPVIKDVPLIQSFDVNLAGRYTNYSVSGSVQTWKVGLDWHVNQDVRFRGTTSIDIRAPTLNDLFAPTSSSSTGYFDLLTNFAGSGTQLVTQGNPALVPEVARTYTAGVVFTPSWIPGLTASVDFYNINLRNAIGSINGTNTQVQALCNNSGGSSPFCGLYQRPFPITNTTSANYPTAVFSQNLNAAFTATEGVDYEIDYNFKLADIEESLPGMLNLRGLLNISPKINSIQFPGANRTYTTNPKGYATIIADYTIGNWSVDVLWHYFGEANKNGLAVNPQIYAIPRVAAFDTTDITITKNITFENDSTAQVYFSVQNIANNNPPITTGSSGNPGFGIPVIQGEDFMGRYFTIGIRGNF